MKTLLLIVCSALIGFMSAPYMAQAIDRQEAADQRMIEQHKLYIGGYLDNAENEQDLDDDIVYQTSAQRKAAIHANAFLARIREAGYE